MDMAEVTGTMVQQPRNGSSSTLEPESPPAVSSTTTDLNCDGMSLSPKTLAPASPKVAVTTSATSSVVNPVATAPAPAPPRTVELRANGIGGSHSSPTPPPPVTTPKPSTSSSSSSRSSTTVKKPGGREPRTRCDVCSGDGTNANLVRCDECYKCYHFSCLMPPVKKTPKVSGWSWSCSDCAPSDEDKSWHL